MIAIQIKKRISGGWLFLVLVLIGYVLLGLLKPDTARTSLLFFANVMTQALPILGLVFILLFVADLILSPKQIKHYLGSESGIKGWIAAVLGGVLSMGPIYAWYGILVNLRQKGMRDGLIAAFLYGRAVKLPLLPMMIYYFGTAYTLTLSLYLIGFAFIVGLLVERFVKKME